MSKLKLVVCALALGITSASVQADSSTVVAQGKITFNGELIAETCQLDEDSVDMQVTLPTLSVQTLAKAGAEAGSTAFQIHAKDCPSKITKVAAHFEVLNSKYDSSTGNLLNTFSDSSNVAAKNVQIRLYNDDSSQVRIGSTGKKFDVVPGDGDKTGTVTMEYLGGYYATGQTTAGKVQASVIYTLAYN